MKKYLTTVFDTVKGLPFKHQVASGILVGSWAVRTSLWPAAAIEGYFRLKSTGADITISSLLGGAAGTMYDSYALPWTILKITQWSAAGYLGAEIVNAIIPKLPKISGLFQRLILDPQQRLQDSFEDGCPTCENIQLYRHTGIERHVFF